MRFSKFNVDEFTRTVIKSSCQSNMYHVVQPEKIIAFMIGVSPVIDDFIINNQSYEATRTYVKVYCIMRSRSDIIRKDQVKHALSIGSPLSSHATDLYIMETLSDIMQYKLSVSPPSASIFIRSTS